MLSFRPGTVGPLPAPLPVLRALRAALRPGRSTSTEIRARRCSWPGPGLRCASGRRAAAGDISTPASSHPCASRSRPFATTSSRSPRSISTWSPRPPRIHLGADERARGAAILDEALPPGGARVGLHVGNRWPAKRWPPERFAALARALPGLGARAVVLGGPGEEAAVSEVAERSGAPRLRGLPLRDYWAVLASLDAFVTNDGRPLHAGPALGVPTVGILGPTVPEIWFPYREEDGHGLLCREICAAPATGTSARGSTACTGSESATRWPRWLVRSSGRRRAVRPREEIRSALVIRHRAGGDLLLTTPALRALRAGLPGARIDVVAARGMGGLLRGNPDVDRVLEFDRRSLGSQAALYWKVARSGYDLVLDLVSNPRTAFLTGLSRAPVRVGYDIPGRRAAYTVRVPREPLGPRGPPRAPLRARGGAGPGPRARDRAARVGAAPRGRARSARRGRGVARRGGVRGPLLACLPSGSWPAKTWPPERFAAVMDALSSEGTPVWLLGPGRRNGVEAARARMRRPSLLAPETDWQGLAALLERCAIFVGNDSGCKHVAAALGIPTVTIFGPTHPATWHPPEGPHVALEAEGSAACTATRTAARSPAIGTCAA